MLRSERPSSFDKLIPVCGNVAHNDLGLLDEDRQILIDNVSVIFHVAASVRFDESLKIAVFNNTRSTRDVCILAKEMKKLVVRNLKLNIKKFLYNFNNIIFYACLLMRYREITFLIFYICF